MVQVVGLTRTCPCWQVVVHCEPGMTSPVDVCEWQLTDRMPIAEQELPVHGV